jgi:hypothetical protein
MKTKDENLRQPRAGGGSKKTKGANPTAAPRIRGRLQEGRGWVRPMCPSPPFRSRSRCVVSPVSQSGRPSFACSLPRRLRCAAGACPSWGVGRRRWSCDFRPLFLGSLVVSRRVCVCVCRVVPALCSFSAVVSVPSPKIIFYVPNTQTARVAIAGTLTLPPVRTGPFATSIDIARLRNVPCIVAGNNGPRPRWGSEPRAR